MTELWLNFKDNDGKDQRVQVAGDVFTIGRHSTNDLCIPNGKLSREHVRIERLGADFSISDCGSSNGTTINGSPLTERTALKAGDRLNLGGGIEIDVVHTSEDQFIPASTEEAENESSAMESDSDIVGETEGSAGYGSEVAASSGGGGIPTIVFIAAPILGVVILVLLGGMVYLASSGDSDKPLPGNDNDFVYSTNRDRDKPPKNREDPPSNDASPNNRNVNDPPPTNTAPPVNSDITASPVPVDLSDSAKCEQRGASFLRSIAQNDPKAFLTGEQAQIINNRIKQISSSPAIADNIASARRNASQIKTLASSKNLKPQLLASAALAKLGTSKGDTLQAAKDMADTLDKLGTQIGSELANDSLLLIAAYDQGTAGDYMKMRNMLQDLATKSTASSREVRTIWFLHKNGKITDSEYNFALQFLAIGVITQNPKDFGVNAEPLVL